MARHPAWIALGAAFCLVASQAALGPSVGGLLRRSLERQAVEYASLQVDVAPLGWLDLLRGRLDRVTVRASEVSFGGPRLAALEMNLTGIVMARRQLLLRGEPVVVGLGPSVVRARVHASALNEYRRRLYPQVSVYFQIADGRVGLVGNVRLWNRSFAVRTFGRLQPEGGDRLRYVPESVEIGRQSLPASWLASFGERLALEFPLRLPLPLVLRGVRMGRGYLELTWEERPGHSLSPMD